MTSPTEKLRSPHHEPSIGAVVDRICDDFENAWRQGRHPEIERYLEKVPLQERGKLLRELVCIELEYRRKSGESCERGEYTARFPELARFVDEAFIAESGPADPHEAPTTVFPSEKVGQAVATSSRYTEIEFHDQGGLGEVFLAYDEQLGRKVAVKFIHEEFQDDEDLLRRFHIEAEVTGRLDHPGVVPVYGVGEGWDGRPFYVMRFLDGDTLDTAIAEFHSRDFSRARHSARRMALHRLLRHLVSGCQTVAYAHNRGVLHRDIKPAHIIIGKYGETLVLDWGLALFVERDARAKASGEKTLLPDRVNRSDSDVGAGTIGYMSPEQLPGSSEPIGPGVDIYSFGATLYKIITGRVAIRENPPNWQERLREGDFPRPRELSRECPPALEAVCLKAMAPRPASRYRTLSEFTEDIERFMADEPVSAYREPPAERFVRSARRHRAWTLAGLAALVSIAAAGVLASVLLQRHAAEQTLLRNQAEEAEALAEETSLASLRGTAAFVAEFLGSRIEQRFRQLELLSEDQELHQLVLAAEGKEVGSAEWNALGEWLARVSQASLDADESDSWFIMDDVGTQLARNPEKDTTGRNFAFRSYFHGGSRDFDPDDAIPDGIRPITTSTVSAVYQGTRSDYKIAFSVPIVAEERVIGVLAISVVWDDLLAFNAVSGETRIQLTDLRPDFLEGEERTGLVLEHPLLVEARKIHKRKYGNPFVREPDAVIATYQRLREIRMGDWTDFEKRSRDYHSLDIACVERDAVAGTADADAWYLGAYEPVFYRDGKGNLVDLGWVVTVYSKGIAGNPPAAESPSRLRRD